MEGYSKANNKAKNESNSKKKKKKTFLENMTCRYYIFFNEKKISKISSNFMQIN